MVRCAMLSPTHQNSGLLVLLAPPNSLLQMNYLLTNIIISHANFFTRLDMLLSVNSVHNFKFSQAVVLKSCPWCGGRVVYGADSNSVATYGVIHISLWHISAHVQILGVSCHLFICTFPFIFTLWVACVPLESHYHILCIY